MPRAATRTLTGFSPWRKVWTISGRTEKEGPSTWTGVVGRSRVTWPMGVDSLSLRLERRRVRLYVPVSAVLVFCSEWGGV